MKKFLLTVVVVLLTTASLLAAPPRARSVLRVRLSDGRPFLIAIDSRHYNRQGTSLTLGDLPAGRHLLRIYTLRPYRDGNGGHATLIYSGNIRVKPGTVTYCLLDRDQDELRIRTRDLDESNYQDGRFVDNDPEWSSPAAPPGGNAGSGGNAGDDVYDRDSPAAASDDTSSTAGASWTSSDMNKLLDKMNGYTADTDKLKALKAALEHQTYTCNQLRTMAGWLSFDVSKLDFLKWAYNNTADKQNFRKLEEVLSFKDSQEDLSKFLSGK